MSCRNCAITIAEDIAAPPEEVFRALTEDVGQWWDSNHTYSGSSANLSLDPRPGGCFCEQIEGGGVQHMEVSQVWPGKTLVLLGGLGPLQPMGVQRGRAYSYKAT